MENGLTLVKVNPRDGGRIAITYEGYNHKLIVDDPNDGKPPMFVISPLKPVVGTDIMLPATFSDKDDPAVFMFKMGVLEERAEEFKEEIDNSKKFCEEFRRRKQEFLDEVSRQKKLLMK